MKEIVFVIAKEDKATLYPIRTITGLEAGEVNGEIWLRTHNIKQKVPLETWKIPFQKTFSIGENQLLFATDSLTPIGKLPEINWKPLSGFLPVVMPVSAFPGTSERKAKLRLIEKEQPQESKAMITSLTIWKKYGESALELKLQRLIFAVSSEDEVLIWGTPLPPIPGREYWKKGQIFLPNGYDFEFSHLGKVVERKLNLTNKSMILFQKNGQFSIIPEHYFVKATRSAIRLTQGKEKDEGSGQ